MFSLNDLLDTCVREGYYTLYIEEGSLPRFMPVSGLLRSFSYYSKREAKFCDSVLPVDRDFLLTCEVLVGGIFSSNYYHFYVYRHGKGVAFRNLPELSKVKGDNLYSLFGNKSIDVGVNVLKTENDFNGIVSAYKFLEYLDSMSLLINIVYLRPLFYFSPVKSKLNILKFSSLDDIEYISPLLNGVLFIPELFNETRLYDLIYEVHKNNPVILVANTSKLEKLISKNVHISKIIELDSKEKLYISNKQDKIEVSINVDRLLRAVKRGSDASI